MEGGSERKKTRPQKGEEKVNWEQRRGGRHAGNPPYHCLGGQDKDDRTGGSPWGKRG